MAPNRKNVSGIVQALSNNDLESLQNSVEPKYLPLTHPSEEAKHQQQEETVAVAPQKAQDSDSYWDWPSPEIVEEPETVDLFSASRIEANLIKEAEDIRDSNVWLRILSVPDCFQAHCC